MRLTTRYHSRSIHVCVVGYKFVLAFIVFSYSFTNANCSDNVDPKIPTKHKQDIKFQTHVSSGGDHCTLLVPLLVPLQEGMLISLFLP